MFAYTFYMPLPLRLPLSTALLPTAAVSSVELIAYRKPGCSGGEGGEGGGEGGKGEGGGGDGGEGGEGGGEGDGEEKQTLKPFFTTRRSEYQYRADASTPSGPSVPE